MDVSSSLESVSTSSDITKSTTSTSSESEIRISTSSTEIKENKENTVIKDIPSLDSKNSIQKSNIGTNDSDQMKLQNQFTALKQPVPVVLPTQSENKNEEVTIRFKRKLKSTQTVPAHELNYGNEHDLSSNTTSENMRQRPRFQRQSSSSQPICASDFASQKPKNWYIVYKKQVALVKKWRLRSLRAEEKMRLMSSQLKMSNIMK